MPETQEDLGAILRTIREVEESLEKREARASAVVMITWGLLAATIFGLYQVHVSVPAAIPEVWVPWLWVPFVIVGYLVSLAVHARLGRAKSELGRRSLTRLLVTLLLPLAIIVVAMLSEVGRQLIPALMVAFLGYTFVAWPRPGGVSRVDRAIAIGCVVAAVGIGLPATWAWANGIASAWYAVFLAGLGSARYPR